MMSFFLLALCVSCAQANAKEQDSCQIVRFADTGWTDISATTGVATTLLNALGYKTETRILSVPVTYASLASGDIDVFLGYWNPSMTPNLKPYLEKGSVETLRYNLTGAKYTLAVPRFIYDQGLKSFDDIARFGPALDYKIYGIEPGNDGNRTILSMLEDGAYGLKDFHIVETSEQAMLSEVKAHIREQKPIVFLGWEPHPMNVRLEMAYLSGGDQYFGPNFGGAKVGTNTRKSYRQDCPNVGQFLSNLIFTLNAENEIMGDILDKGEDPSYAAQKWLQKNPDAIIPWLENVTTFDGNNALDAVTTTLSAKQNQNNQAYKIPVGKWADHAVEWLIDHASIFFDTIRLGLDEVLKITLTLLLWPNPLILIAILCLLAWIIQRNWRIVLLTSLGFLFVINQGYWIDTMETLTLLLWSCILCMGIGVPIGVMSAHHPRLYRFIQPILDLMQTLPIFVYLIPAIIFFRIGMVPGLIATVVFVLPAPIRLSQQGIASTPYSLIEAGKAFGANRRQILWKIEFPHAMPQIRAGMTQTIMLSLSMVVIAATVGGNGLGVKVYRALQQHDAAMGFEAGCVIVVVAIVLDRLFRPGKAH
ncbi:choline ABC transporter, periplasmic binding protein [Bartonella tamiae Th307]|uniref:Choline ABC transporter, periplasmic binding protein n=1 Tax=Bartonella tamiae Th239 TaxID=1094558 RepID=J1JX88_9HYPH|nr:choline ABC transporter, periplasmic binding protein [Bartonella tamiae Th239]EJF95371.1 choline ABC transporter, periplasmic binding protein [Bartonella tamiae Th307]